MKSLAKFLGTAAFFAAVMFAAETPAAERSGGPALREVSVTVPMPPGVQVQPTELHGSVFADESGRTLYMWPSKGMRNGVAGEDKGKILCDDSRISETVGLQSIYPPGLELPDLEHRPTCVQVWPPFLAAADAKPVGKWTILARKDGSKQWAYDGQAIYRSSLDQRPGDVLGTVMRPVNRDDTSPRLPIGPPADVAPGFGVETTLLGRLMFGPNGMSVYTWDRDTRDKSLCEGSCLDEWDPVRAPSFFQAHGEWATIERSPGIRQITYRGKPLYTHPSDHSIHSLEGGDAPGWKNVYTQYAPRLPAGFTLQDMSYGQVIADAHGRTIYYYSCDEDTLDQLSCDSPTTTQVYRLAVCGNGDPQRCLQTWPLVLASATEKSDSRTWSIITLDPVSGRLAQPGQAGAVRAWAYRGRPIYYYVGDHGPGDLWGNGLGELIGKHNGFRAFVVRDEL